MKNLLRSLAVFWLSILTILQAQVPQLINFQGRVAVDGVNFNGAAEFKFALVNGDGAVSFWSNDGTSAGGNEPTGAVPIPVSQGLYSVLLGDPTLTNMTPISAAIFTNADVRLRIWFNDGTNGSQQLSPDQRIAAVGYAMMAANVADGVVTSAKLADGAVTGAKLAASAVSAANIAPHSIGSTQLSTNSAADNLRDSGGLVLSDQSNATNLLNAGYVRIGQVSTDVDFWQRVGPLPPGPRAAHSAVWTGSEMIVWGGSTGFPQGPFANSGARYSPTTDSWSPVSTNNAPAPRANHAAVWTGREMLIWGAVAGGGRYNPETDSWRTISTNNAPRPATGTSAVWTGNEMIVWGGAQSQVSYSSSGGRYNPVLDIWNSVSTNAAPAARRDHCAVWTGSEMIVWGGITSTGPLNTGGRYSPATDAWTPTSTVNAPAGRSQHVAVWDSNELIVWGGLTTSGYGNTGSRYNPATDSWTATSTLRAPSATQYASAVWSGADMIVWNGAAATGARYHPATNGWTLISTNNAPVARSSFSTVWSGQEMIVWGGTSRSQPLTSGGRYNPLTDSWVATISNPVGRTNHTAVWTGAEMIIWGGQTNSFSSSGRLNSGGRFNLATGRWTPTTVLNAPTPRSGHTAVWTGTEMIIWGGAGPNFRFNEPGPLETKNNGGRYNPARNLWTSIETNGAPAARTGHTAVWTGNEMIVWGGNRNALTPTEQGAFLNTGARYDPNLNAWTSMSSSGPPTARYQHGAVWTGNEMIVWGGFGLAATNVLAQPNYLNTGARYFPSLNAWIATTTNGLPQASPDRAIVWTGDEMIVWGPRTGGARYSPAADAWLPIAAKGAPAVGTGYSAVWSGSEMIVWGGISSKFQNKAGGRYSPATDAWTSTSTDGLPDSGRYGHSAVWTSNGMLIFGGLAIQQGLLETTDLYSLTKPMYLYKKP